jgi:RNA polymerase sigma factor (sigma-70 family)
MDDGEWLARQFEEHRPRLRAVAARLLGSGAEADDAVQEAWFRLNRMEPGTVENLGGWLTTVVGRVALNMLRSRATRREEPLDGFTADGGGTDGRADAADPAESAVLADSVGMALLVVLETLTPAERLAFVLHDLFDVPFDEIATVIDRSPAAARQLASRARRRVQGQTPGADPTPGRRRAVVAAFLTASRNGDFGALLGLLDPDAVLRADAAAVTLGAAREVRGAEAVAATFSGRARAARLALVDGRVQAVWAQGGQPRVVFTFDITDGRVTGIELIADPDRLRDGDMTFLES